VDAAEKGERTSRARRDESLVAGHDARSLAERFMAVGAPASTAKVTAGKVLRHVFAKVGDVPWDLPTFTKLGIGAWAHATLLNLDPSPALTVDHEAPATDGTIRLVLKARSGAFVKTVFVPGPVRPHPEGRARGKPGAQARQRRSFQPRA